MCSFLQDEEDIQNDVEDEEDIQNDKKEFKVAAHFQSRSTYGC